MKTIASITLLVLALLPVLAYDHDADVKRIADSVALRQKNSIVHVLHCYKTGIPYGIYNLRLIIGNNCVFRG